MIDFDRNQYGYLWHDIGRTVLSFALREGQLDMTAVHTLMRGYQTVYPYFGHRFYRHHRQDAERGGRGNSDVGKN